MLAQASHSAQPPGAGLSDGQDTMPLFGELIDSLELRALELMAKHEVGLQVG